MIRDFLAVISIIFVAVTNGVIASLLTVKYLMELLKSHGFFK